MNFVADTANIDDIVYKCLLRSVSAPYSERCTRYVYDFEPRFVVHDIFQKSMIALKERAVVSAKKMQQNHIIPDHDPATTCLLSNTVLLLQHLPPRRRQDGVIQKNVVSINLLQQNTWYADTVFHLDTITGDHS